MTQVCSQCATVNPPEAAYCYFDGVLLAGHAGGAAAQQQLFPSQFVFPNGQGCRSFDQLAVCCQQNWAMALDMLKQGFFAGFLGSIGRADLALAAQESARFPDPDRGLDQFLSRLPTRVLRPPQLEAAPKEVHLGQLPVGIDRRIEIQLSNLGMRLLYGSVASDCNWLTLGDAPGSPQKLFQCSGDTVLAVNVRGQHLRAGIKTLEGRLLVDSNGGTAELVVRADVPVSPFAGGVLTGAMSPRQVAEKAKAAPKEAALQFENGAVALWFAANGWTYPVQGPAASGLSAVQQFFEALGLTPPPRVEISTQSIQLSGKAGESLHHVLEVTSAEKRPVYAHAVADQPWLEVGTPEFQGRVVLLNVQVKAVPPRPGETLYGKVTVRANGNQRFDVAVALTVAEKGWGYLSPPPQPPLPPVLEVVPESDLPVALPVNHVMVSAVPSVAAALPISASLPNQVGHFTGSASVALPPPLPVLIHPPAPPRVPRRRRARQPAWVHLLPAGLLFLALLGVMLRDALLANTVTVGDDGIAIDRRPRVRLHFEDGHGDMRGAQSMRFGLVAFDGSTTKNLTFHEQGATNNTVVRVNGQERVFGHAPGHWKQRAAPLNRGPWGPKDGKRSTWLYDEQIEVTQTVEVVPGDAVEVSPGNYLRHLDTCLVRYQITNKGKVSQSVGLRVLLDTMIGGNDGVPFVIPGDAALCDTCRTFDEPAQVPDFLLALEYPSLQNPGTVAQLGLKLGPPVEAPGRVVLTAWPDHRLMGAERMQGWEVPLVSMKQLHDSAVALYWNERPLPPGETREVGFRYGLGSVSSGKAGSLGIAVNGDLYPDRQFSIVALTNDPRPGQTLTVNLEDGLVLLSAYPNAQPVPQLSSGSPNHTSPVTWRAQATRPGQFRITVQSSTGETQTRTVVIRARTIF